MKALCFDLGVKVRECLYLTYVIVLMSCHSSVFNIATDDLVVYRDTVGFEFQMLSFMECSHLP